MEVLQTSALPLGDGADILLPREMITREAAGYSTGLGPARARRRGNVERGTGFEPATSTLARSHSTTELFPPATTPKRTTAAETQQGSPPSSTPTARVPGLPPRSPHSTGGLPGPRSPPRVAKDRRRFLRRRRIQVEPGRPLEAGHLRQLRDDLHVPVV